MQAHGGSKTEKRAGRVIADGFCNMDCFQGFNLIDNKSEHTSQITLFSMMKGEVKE